MRIAKGWWTLIAAVSLAGLGAAQTFDWAQIIPPDKVGVVMLVIGALMAFLRYITDTPIGSSK